MTRHFHTCFSNFRDDCFAAFMEFIGTTVFLLLGLGGIQAAVAESGTGATPSSSVELILYVSTSMGLSLLVSAWLFYRVTGGLFNPNVSLSLVLVGVIGPVRFILYCIAQLLGGIAAAALVLALTPGKVAFNTSLHNDINASQGVFIEMFITAFLVLAVLMLAAEKHKTTPFAPIGIGLTLFSTHLFAVYYTGASVNTARSFGPAVVTGFPYHKHWVYWVGPGLGSLLGASFYALLKEFNYWKLNPDQAAVEDEKSPENPVKAAKAFIARRSSAASGMNAQTQSTTSARPESTVHDSEKSETATTGRHVNYSPV